MYSVKCAVYSAQYSVKGAVCSDSVQCAVKCIACSTKSAVCSVQQCSVQCAVYNLQCAVCSSAVPGSPCVSYPAALARISGGNFRGLIAINCREHDVPDCAIYCVLGDRKKDGVTQI